MTTTTDTPRTDAVPSNQPMLSAQSDPVELYHKLIAVTVDLGKALDACVEYRDQLAASKAEVKRLREYYSRFILVSPIEAERVEKVEAEVERLKAELAAETANREKCCRDGNAYSDELWRKLKMTEDENEKLKAGKVFVDPKWIYDLETQLAKAHEELCQAGLREYGN